MGTIDGAAHRSDLFFGAVNHGVNIGQRGPEPVLRPVGKVAVVRDSVANPGVGNLKEDRAARTGEKDALRTNVCKSSSHLNTVAP